MLIQPALGDSGSLGGLSRARDQVGGITNNREESAHVLIDFVYIALVLLDYFWLKSTRSIPRHRDLCFPSSGLNRFLFRTIFNISGIIRLYSCWLTHWLIAALYFT